VIVSGGTRRRFPSAAQLTSTPCSAHFFLDLRAFVTERDPYHQPADTGIVFRETFPEALAFPANIREYLLDHADGCKGSRTGKGAAGKRAPVLAFLKLEVFTGYEGPHGKAACDPLCDGDHIGLHFRVLDGKPFAGTAHAGLHLVNDHEGAGLVADLAYSFEEAVGRDDNAGLALDWFDNDTGGIAVNNPAERVQVPVLDKGLFHPERLKRFADRRLVGHGK